MPDDARETGRGGVQDQPHDDEDAPTTARAAEPTEAAETTEAAEPMEPVEPQVEVRVRHGDGETVLTVTRGRVLRDVLLEAGLSPYTRVTRRANCGGRGLCATCGVRLREGPAADHWHDRLAARFGYPRLSCQIRVTGDVVVDLVDEKVVWGARER